jgi:ATP-binding cassette subfamily C exporter for protease/lipase
MDTLSYLKQQGRSVLVITHRTSILPAADKVLVLRDGQVAAYGPRDEVLAALQKVKQQSEQHALQRQIASQAVQQKTIRESAT